MSSTLRTQVRDGPTTDSLAQLEDTSTQHVLVTDTTHLERTASEASKKGLLWEHPEAISQHAVSV